MIYHSLKFDRPVIGAALAVSSPANGPNSSIQIPLSHPNESDAPRVGSTIINNPAKTTETIIERSAQDDLDDCQDLLVSIAESVGRLMTQSDALISNTLENSVRLATLIVKHVVGSSEALQLDRLSQLLKEAMNGSEPIVAVYLNAADKQKLSERIEDDLSIELPFVIKTDPAIDSGECRIEYSSHEMISDFDSQLVEIESRLREVQNVSD